MADGLVGVVGTFGQYLSKLFLPEIGLLFFFFSTVMACVGVHGA